MKNCNAPENQTTRRILFIACTIALTAAFTVSLLQPAHADRITVPSVPLIIQVPTGNTAFLVGHGVGTQNYICLPSTTSTSGVAYVLFTPEATLFSDSHKQIITHFFSPNLNPDLNLGEIANTIRVTWQHSRDTSTIWAKVHQTPNGDPASSSDPKFVEPGAVAWLLLERVGSQNGPTGGHTLTATTFIQRLNTSGGVAPSLPPSGCDSLTDVGHQAFVPYKADYFFYKKAAENDADDGN